MEAEINIQTVVTTRKYESRDLSLSNTCTRNHSLPSTDVTQYAVTVHLIKQLCGEKSFWISCKFLSQSINSLHFMQTEYSSPHIPVLSQINPSDALCPVQEPF
jgi:hypothetical protein